MARILVAMSGGVDSAVSAFLLKKEGHDITGANMRFWEYKVDESCEIAPGKLAKKRITSCCSPEDMGDAERSARGIGIPFYALKMESDFRQSVIDPFINDYRQGRTPNPCVHCNTFIKFGEFYEKADAMGFESIATGHYARIIQLDNGRYAIAPAADAHKDQAYYLYGLSQEALAKTVFPLAGLTKEEVRELAEENNIPVAQKPESQEICFIPENNYRNFLKKEGVAFQRGYLRNTQGNILGKHDGKENFTIGQRKGLNIALGHPLYVLEIKNNGDVIVGTKEEMNRRAFYAIDAIFQGIDEATLQEQGTIACLAQIRYNGEPVEAEISLVAERVIRCELKADAWAVTPGQAAVFYHPEERYILAGGKIRISRES